MGLRRKACTLSFAAIAAFCGVGQAQGLLPHAQDGVTYVIGGVGTEEQEAMKELQQQGFNLKLLFAEKGTGAYLANVHVTVADPRGRTLLDAVADGPALFAKLPPGRYVVTAEHNGVRQSRTVNTGRGAQLAMYWAPEGGSSPEPASARAPHGDAPPLAPSHAGEAAGARR